MKQDVEYKLELTDLSDGGVLYYLDFKSLNYRMSIRRRDEVSPESFEYLVGASLNCVFIGFDYLELFEGLTEPALTARVTVNGEEFNISYTEMTVNPEGLRYYEGALNSSLSVSSNKEDIVLTEPYAFSVLMSDFLYNDTANSVRPFLIDNYTLLQRIIGYKDDIEVFNFYTGAVSQTVSISNDGGISHQIQLTATDYQI